MHGRAELAASQGEGLGAGWLPAASEGASCSSRVGAPGKEPRPWHLAGLSWGGAGCSPVEELNSQLAVSQKIAAGILQVST